MLQPRLPVPSAADFPAMPSTSRSGASTSRGPQGSRVDPWELSPKAPRLELPEEQDQEQPEDLMHELPNMLTENPPCEGEFEAELSDSLAEQLAALHVAGLTSPPDTVYPSDDEYLSVDDGYEWHDFEVDFEPRGL